LLQWSDAIFHYGMKDIFLGRVQLLFVLLLLLAFALLGKLFFVQVMHGKDFKERAGRQYVSSVADAFNRGSIFFTRKDGTLIGAATLKSGFVVAIHPGLLADAQEAFKKLFDILPKLDVVAFFLKAGKKDDPYEEIARRVPEESATRIKEMEIPGVSIFSEKWRYYPGETIAAHTVGFVGWNGDSLGGRYGLERYYDDVLRRGEENLYVNFFAEIFANLGKSLFYRGSREGDIVISIEPEVERHLETVLRDVVKKWNADSGGAIIIDPKTGAVYALASYPTFDPNHFEKEKKHTIFSNPLVENMYEMGSIVKPLTMAAGLDARVVTAKSTYNDAGFLVLNTARIGNYDGKARGVVSMQEVLNQSLNTGAVHVMQKVGKEKFAKYMLSFGIGEETGIDLPNEIPGLVTNLKSSRDIEYATASFGQGIAMTPIAMTRALAVLANKGVLVTPHIVTRIDYPLSSKEINLSDDVRRVIKEEAAEEITRMLVGVVDTALVGGVQKLPRYSIAAKTGTAQMALPEGGGYYDDRYLHSFFGYFPAYDARFLVFLYMVYPKEVRYSSQTLTDPFFDVAKFLINYYEIPPDR